MKKKIHKITRRDHQIPPNNAVTAKSLSVDTTGRAGVVLPCLHEAAGIKPDACPPGT